MKGYGLPITLSSQVKREHLNAISACQVTALRFANPERSGGLGEAPSDVCRAAQTVMISDVGYFSHKEMDLRRPLPVTEYRYFKAPGTRCRRGSRAPSGRIAETMRPGRRGEAIRTMKRLQSSACGTMVTRWSPRLKAPRKRHSQEPVRLSQVPGFARVINGEPKRTRTPNP